MKTWSTLILSLAITSKLLGQGYNPPTFPKPIIEKDCRGNGEKISREECDKVFAYSAGASVGGTVLGDHWNNISVDFQQNRGFKFDTAKVIFTNISDVKVLEPSDYQDDAKNKEEMTAFLDGYGELSSKRPLEFTLLEEYLLIEEQEFGVVTQKLTMTVTGTIKVASQGYYSMVLTGFNKKLGKRTFKQNPSARELELLAQ